MQQLTELKKPAGTHSLTRTPVEQPTQCSIQLISWRHSKRREEKRRVNKWINERLTSDVKCQQRDHKAAGKADLQDLKLRCGGGGESKGVDTSHPRTKFLPTGFICSEPYT